MRKPIIGGNWKMNTDLGEARELAGGLVERLGVHESVEVVICPPFTNLSAVRDIIRSSGMTLGAQDVFWEPKGAFTGEISSAMLQSVGVEFVIVGHSERRHILNESSEIVNRKAQAALSAGLKVILAIGETEYERQDGRTESVLRDQLERSLSDIGAAALRNVVLAYEPVWAIGTGLTATPDQAQEAHAFVRSWIAEKYETQSADTIRIQYGGSVTAANAGELLSRPDIDGALVGGGSLKPDDFAAIVSAAGSPG